MQELTFSFRGLLDRVELSTHVLQPLLQLPPLLQSQLLFRFANTAFPCCKWNNDTAVTPHDIHMDNTAAITVTEGGVVCKGSKCLVFKHSHNMRCAQNKSLRCVFKLLPVFPSELHQFYWSTDTGRRNGGRHGDKERSTEIYNGTEQSQKPESS